MHFPFIAALNSLNIKAKPFILPRFYFLFLSFFWEEEKPLSLVCLDVPMCLTSRHTRPVGVPPPCWWRRWCGWWFELRWEFILFQWKAKRRKKSQINIDNKKIINKKTRHSQQQRPQTKVYFCKRTVMAHSFFGGGETGEIWNKNKEQYSHCWLVFGHRQQYLNEWRLNLTFARLDCCLTVQTPREATTTATPRRPGAYTTTTLTAVTTCLSN